MIKTCDKGKRNVPLCSMRDYLKLPTGSFFNTSFQWISG